MLTLAGRVFVRETPAFRYTRQLAQLQNAIARDLLVCFFAHFPPTRRAHSPR